MRNTSLGSISALEGFGEDVLFGLPTTCGSPVETTLQVGIAATVVGLHNSVVEILGQFGFHVIGNAVDDQQVRRATLRSYELAKLLYEDLHVVTIVGIHAYRTHKRTRERSSSRILVAGLIV